MFTMFITGCVDVSDAQYGSDHWSMGQQCPSIFAKYA